jgi:tRNA threonylcarbamoyladenosine biosynthesis protein TsaB
MSSSESILLALDTSTRTTGIALYDGVQVLCESTWTSLDYHTVELAPAISDALRRSNLENETIAAITLATGPGSFTGLRIGMALAKGLTLVRHLPIVGVPSLDILAFAQPLMDCPLIALLRVGRGRLAVGRYEVHGKAWRSAAPLQVCTPPELVGQINYPAFICGEINEAERHLFHQAGSHLTLASPARSLRRPGFLAEIGWKRWKSGRIDDPNTLSPTYLHYKESIPG